MDMYKKTTYRLISIYRRLTAKTLLVLGICGRAVGGGREVTPPRRERNLSAVCAFEITGVVAL